MNDNLKTALPAVVGASPTVSTFLGLTWPEWATALTIVYLLWAIANQVLKFWRNIRGYRQDAA